MIPFMITFWASGSVTPPTIGGPLFLENIARHNITRSITLTGSSVSFCPLVITQSMNFGKAYFGLFHFSSIVGTSSFSLQFSAGIYSLTGSTLTLLNLASGAFTSSTNATPPASTMTWVSMATSAASTLAAGQYWLGLQYRPNVGFAKFGVVPSGLVSVGFTGSNPAYARMSVTTASMPASVAISDLVTFNEGTRLPYVLITS